MPHFCCKKRAETTPGHKFIFFEKRLKWESGRLVNSVLMKDKGSYSGHDKMKSSYELKANTLKFF